MSTSVQIWLADDEIEEVKDLIASTDHAQHLRKALAILWLCQGNSVQQVSDRLCVSRTTVYNWVTRFRDRGDLDLAERIVDAGRPGRPRTALGVVDPLIADVVGLDPCDVGFRETAWTADLLALYLQREHGIEVSTRSIRLAVERLGVVLKRSP